MCIITLGIFMLQLYAKLIGKHRILFQKNLHFAMAYKFLQIC